MPCLVAIFAFCTPRFVLFLVWLFSHYLDRAYQSILWPLLGFFFMPLTTLAYAYAINSNGSVTGAYIFLVLLAALVDLGILGSSEHSRRRRSA